jgi:hypothetical protein
VTGWAILPEQLEVCRHADGSEWLLGAGADQVLMIIRLSDMRVVVRAALCASAYTPWTEMRFAQYSCTDRW